MKYIVKDCGGKSVTVDCFIDIGSDCWEIKRYSLLLSKEYSGTGDAGFKDELELKLESL